MILPSKERLERGRAAVIACPRGDCRICVSACGFSAIRLENGRPFSDPAKCVGCGGCAAICPEGAVILLKISSGGVEVTYPHGEPLPDLDDTVFIKPISGGAPVPARVIQAVPKRPNGASGLIRAIAPIEYIAAPASEEA